MIYGVFGLRDVNSILILYRTIYIYTCLLNSMNLSAPAVLIHFTLLRAPYRYSSQLTRTVSKGNLHRRPRHLYTKICHYHH